MRFRYFISYLNYIIKFAFEHRPYCRASVPAFCVGLAESGFHAPAFRPASEYRIHRVHREVALAVCPEDDDEHNKRVVEGELHGEISLADGLADMHASFLKDADDEDEKDGDADDDEVRAVQA